MPKEILKNLWFLFEIIQTKATKIVLYYYVCKCLKLLQSLIVIAVPTTLQHLRTCGGDDVMPKEDPQNVKWIKSMGFV